MNSIITLTTDFGTRDGYVGAMKGKILTLAPQVTIVDITHEIDPQDILSATWCLARSAPQFPSGSIHVVVVDPGVGSSRDAVIIQADGHWFVGPDNGVFTQIVERSSQLQGYTAFTTTKWWKPHQSFDGLAVFSPIAACLANGENIEDLGQPTDDLESLSIPDPDIIKEAVTGQIILFDRFGNGITNIRKSHLSTLPQDKIAIAAAGRNYKFARFYSEDDDGDLVAIINSDGFLELAVNRGSAREACHLEYQTEVMVTVRK